MLLLLIQETRRSMTNFWLWESPEKYYWHSLNLFYSKTYIRTVYRTQSNIYSKVFLWFSQICPNLDVLLGSKYLPSYIYIQVRPVKIILHIILSILNIFVVKYLSITKEKLNKVAINKLTENSEVYISH